MYHCTTVLTVLADQSGSAFTVEAGQPSVWINTIYDLEQGHLRVEGGVAGDHD